MSIKRELWLRQNSKKWGACAQPRERCALLWTIYGGERRIVGRHRRRTENFVPFPHFHFASKWICSLVLSVCGKKGNARSYSHRRLSHKVIVHQLVHYKFIVHQQMHYIVHQLVHYKSRHFDGTASLLTCHSFICKETLNSESSLQHASVQ